MNGLGEYRFLHTCIIHWLTLLTLKMILTINILINTYNLNSV